MMGNNKMKILHIVKSLGRGGAEMLLQETLKQHDQSKFEFHYIFCVKLKLKCQPFKNSLC